MMNDARARLPTTSPAAADRMAAARPPSIDHLLKDAGFLALTRRFGRTATRDVLREILAARRGKSDAAQDPPSLAQLCEERLAMLWQPSLRPVLNLTGTVLHTNLGRARLPAEAAKAVAAVLTQACNLEFDLERGGRGERDAHIETLLCRLTGAEAATIVNNNAAAVLLTLNTLALRRSVAVSRGELVEIGDSFRIPEVMSRAGTRLREVGTTNRTHLKDYAEAIEAGAAMVMKVHPSNYEVQGFTAAVPERDLAALCRERGIPFVADLGSGTLVELGQWGVPSEPTVQGALAHADLVLFSGDKLLGGVQAGLILGRRDLVDRIRRNPLKRALRVDKMTIATMEAVLRLYLHPERLGRSLPTLRLLSRPAEEIAATAWRLRPALARALGSGAEVAVSACRSQIGSGALPTRTLASFCLVVSPASAGRGAGKWLLAMTASFRALPVPIIGRIEDGALRLDLRTLEDEGIFLEQIAHLSEAPASSRPAAGRCLKKPSRAQPG